jgi:large repetitive protein
MLTLHWRPALCWLSVLTLLSACSNGRGSVDERSGQGTPTAFFVGGTVTGLAGAGLVLQNNGGADRSIAANGAFTLPGALTAGAAYNVTVLAQPSNPPQSCTIANGAGSIAGSDVTNIVVTCSGAAFSVQGAVTGLLGSGLVLQNNAADDLLIAANGAFGFTTLLATGTPYNVTVRTQPSNPAQTCSVGRASGTIGSTHVTDVTVICATGQFSISGSVSGLLGAGLVLQNNAGDDLPIATDGRFTFTTPLARGATYAVTVLSQPANPAQNCVVRNAAGTINDANVADVDVLCTTDRFTVGGQIAGLAGSGLQLRVNNAHELLVNRNGAFAFGVALPNAASYSVTVSQQPHDPTQECSIQNGVGVIAGGNVTNIAVVCATSSFSVGGSVSGLAGSGLVVQLNGGDDLAIHSNGDFTFGTRIESGAQYDVSIKAQPSTPDQICTVANASGVVGGGAVSNVRITCAANTFSVGGSVGGLLGSGLVLQNNGGDPVGLESDGGFTFPRALASGAQYNVTVRTQPSNPDQACRITNGAGVIADRNVTNVLVTCTASEFTVGGEVGGLSGSGLTLSNNGDDDLRIDGNGRFVFPTTLPTGARYDVRVAEQPRDPAQTCTVANASGAIEDRNVTNINVSCASEGFTIGGHVSDLSGSGLVLQNNGGDNLPIASNGSFEFPTPLPEGAQYNVTVAAQPVNPSQQCEVKHGSGSVHHSDVRKVEVKCRDD